MPVIRLVRWPRLTASAKGIPGTPKGAFTGASDKGKVGLTPIPIKCTVIAATNAVMADMVGRKKFRQDLFFPLNTFPVKIPPLRERPEDIFELVTCFIGQYNKTYKLNRKLSSRGYRKLRKYPFPGNVRELKDLVKKAVVLNEEDLPDDLVEKEIGTSEETHNHYQVCFEPGGESFERQVADFEKQILMSAMIRHDTTRALASYLQMSQAAVVRRQKKHDLSKHLRRKRRNCS